MGVVIQRVFCLDLPTAGLVIGFLGIFGGLWEMIETLLGLAYFADYYSDLDEKVKTNTYMTLASIFIACLIEVLVAILLAMGTQKKSPNMLLPWLILKGILLAVLIPVASLCILFGIYFLFNDHGGMILIHSIVLLIGTVVYSYTYLIIYSLYHFIRNELANKPHRIDAENLYYNNSNDQYYNKT